MGVLLASKVVFSALPGRTPKTRNTLLRDEREGDRRLIKLKSELLVKYEACKGHRSYLYEPVATLSPSPLRQHSNLSKMESFS